ncbi:MAG: BON domain-containing protein [Chloroflexi bacterium]|nr:BON domain-containing protein [Chloroflexota bacterium]
MDAPYNKVLKQVEDALLKDPRTKNAVIDIGYNRGVITLSGNVKNEKERQAAEEIVRSLPDVLQVVNELKVR